MYNGLKFFLKILHCTKILNQHYQIPVLQIYITFFRPNPIEKTDFSVYDLRDHPDFHFKSGCLIIHISPETNPDLNTLTAGQVLSAGPNGRVIITIHNFYSNFYNI
jgi:hypothetical protein